MQQDCKSTERIIFDASRETVESLSGHVLNEESLAYRRGWRGRAACRGKPSIWWFPVRRASYGLDATQTGSGTNDSAPEIPPKHTCFGCSVRYECLSEAIHEDDQGTWGGTSHILRNRIRNHLLGTDSARVAPSCGTASGWLRHRRMQDHEEAECEPCKQAAACAGFDVNSESVSPMTFALSLRAR